MSVNPADPNGPPHYYDQNNKPDSWFDEVQVKPSGYQAMSGTSMSAPFMMMIIFQMRMFFQQLQAQGISNYALRTALYALLRIQLNKAVDNMPGSEESWHTAVEDVNNFNAVADKLFEAYAKDRSICREGLTTVLTGDNFSITLNMSCPNSDSNVTGQSSKSNKSS